MNITARQIGELKYFSTMVGKVEILSYTLDGLLKSVEAYKAEKKK